MATTRRDTTEAGTHLPDIEKDFNGQRAQDGDSIHFDPAAERRVVRKIDLRLMPLVMFLYLLAYLDRSNIGYALLFPTFVYKS